MVADKKKPLTPAQLAKAEEAQRKESEAVKRAYDKQRLLRQENGVRMVVLRERVKMIENFYKVIAKQHDQRKREKSWLRYVNCVNQPFGDRPAELREYLAKWDCEIAKKVKEYFDWQLDIDERTLLDQSPFRVDLSERCLRSLQPDVAPPFFEKIKDALKVLDEVNDVLLRNKKISIQRMDEVKMVRESFQQFIWKFLDYMTHIIAGNIDREMTLLSPTDAEFNFKSEIFSVGIFTNRDVPLSGPQPDDEKLKINLEAVQVQIECPHSLSFDGSAMRVFWFAFDHYSDLSPSHKIETDDANQMQRNMFQSNRQEFDKREIMEQATLMRMRQERADYEANLIVANDPVLKAKMDAANKSNNAKEKGKGKGGKEKKPKKGKGKKEKKVPEPPVVTEFTTVDLSKEFNTREAEKHEKRMEKLNPEVGLLLKPTELNQRNFQVLGGTFAIHYLERPKQFKHFVNHIFQRTYELPDIIKYHKYYVPFQPYRFDSTSSFTEAQIDHIRKQEELAKDQLIEVTVRLPANICWFDEPRVVRWQPWEESPEFQQLSAELQHFNLHFEQIELEKSLRLFNRIIKSNSANTYDVDIIEDFNLAMRTEDIRLYYVLTKYIIPKLSINYRFDCEVREEEEKLELELKRREHLKRELEEDLRVMQEAKELRRQHKQAKELDEQGDSPEQEQNDSSEHPDQQTKEPDELGDSPVPRSKRTKKLDEQGNAPENAQKRNEEQGDVGPSPEPPQNEPKELDEPSPSSDPQEQPKELDESIPSPEQPQELPKELDDQGQSPEQPQKPSNEVDEQSPSTEQQTKQTEELGEGSPSSEQQQKETQEPNEVTNSSENQPNNTNEPDELSHHSDLLNHSSMTLMDTESDESHSRPQSLDEIHVEAQKTFVQGTAAREMFPKHDNTKPIQLDPPLHRPTPDSIMLSQLVQSIDEFNQHELPIFQGKQLKTDTPDITDVPPEISSRNSFIAETKKDIRSKSTATELSFEGQLNIAENPPVETKGLHLVEHYKGKWISDGIYVQNYNVDEQVITFKTTNIGIFGFAQNQYVHFPFHSWEMSPNYEEVPMSVRFKLAARHISLECLITAEGFLLSIIRPKPALCPVKAPTEAISLKELIKFLKDANLNIFPNLDAYWYIGDETNPDETRFSYKHEPMVNHTYQAMAQFCQTHHFKHSPWNRLADRREVIVLCRQIVEGRQPEALIEAQITPNEAYFVTTKEKCTPLDVVELEMRKDPPNQEFNCDMFDLLATQSIDKSKKRQTNTNIELRYNVAELLKAVQPLSYS